MNRTPPRRYQRHGSGERAPTAEQVEHSAQDCLSFALGGIQVHSERPLATFGDVCAELRLVRRENLHALAASGNAHIPLLRIGRRSAGARPRWLRRASFAAARKRFPNASGVLSVWLGSAFEQAIGARFEMLREVDERRDTERILAALNAADGLGVDTDQFCETLLRQIRPQTGVGHVAANDAQESFVGHATSWSVSALR